MASDFSVTHDEVTCQQFVELITDYFEGALGLPTLSRVEEHLVMCDRCVTYADQMEATVTAVHELGNHEPATPRPPIALDRLQTAVLAALRRQATLDRRLLRTRVQPTSKGASSASARR